MAALIEYMSTYFNKVRKFCDYSNTIILMEFVQCMQGNSS